MFPHQHDPEQPQLQPQPQRPQQPQPGPAPSPAPQPKTYLIIGASRGIGLEFCRQLLAAQHRVIATARRATGASALWALTGSAHGGNLSILECDVTEEGSVGRFVAGLVGEMGRWGRVRGGGGGGWLFGGVGGGIGGGGSFRGEGERYLMGIDVCVVNAGVLVYPSRVMEMTFSQFTHHLTTNTIGPLLLAAALLRHASPPIPIATLVFMSSDSGSATRFRPFEDGFAAYAASKAALNQGLRHLAAELARLPPEMPARETVVLALHPGEVATDVEGGGGGGLGQEAGGEEKAGWRGEEVEGIISPEESIRCMLRVIEERGKGGSGERGGGKVGVATFWDWEGRPFPW